MKPATPIVKDLVLAGGGHAHVIVLRMLAMNPVPGLQVTLISPDVRTPYSGMLPGVVAGHYTADDIHIELGPLCRFAGARFIRGRVTGLDTARRTVQCEGRPDIPYDVLSLDVGITPAVDQIPGAREHAIAVKPINTFLARWYAFLKEARAGHVRHVGFVGAGAGGVELCLAVNHRLQTEGLRDIDVHLFTDKEGVLPGYPEQAQQLFMSELRTRGVEVHTGFRAGEITESAIWSNSGTTVDLDAVFLVTNAASQPWLKETGLPLDDNGFIKVRDTLQTTTHPEIFAVGDIAANVDYPRPKAGVYAVRQGKPLCRNLKRVLLGKAARPFRPQREFLSLISMGRKTAVASKWGRVRKGDWLWRWKDWIDQRFMARFNALPEMKTEKQGGLLAAFDAQMQCGGCGSKVAADLLQETLNDLGVTGDLDDAAMYDVPDGKTLLHTVDHFRAFVDDPYLFARIAVNHALSDIYAMGGTPVTALAVMTLPFATPAKTRELLAQLMRGTLTQLEDDGVALVGGHTSEGMELSLGFAANGLVDRHSALQKSGMQPGDALVLTKPLGTGAVFAADMQAKAKGAWVQAAIDVMLQSNREAAALLKSAGATAMTDVTGFGLAGHLSEMTRASGTGARLQLADVPALHGAYEALAAGIESTLQAGNERAIADLFSGPGDMRQKVLFDPQTSGGLLASIPAGIAGTVVASLQAAGYVDTAIIGEVIEGDAILAR